MKTQNQFIQPINTEVSDWLRKIWEMEEPPLDSLTLIPNERSVVETSISRIPETPMESSSFLCLAVILPKF